MVKHFKLYTRAGAKLPVHDPMSHYVVALAEGDIRDAIRAVEALPGEAVIQGFGLGPGYIPRPDQRVVVA